MVAYSPCCKTLCSISYPLVSDAMIAMLCSLYLTPTGIWMDGRLVCKPRPRGWGHPNWFRAWGSSSLSMTKCELACKPAPRLGSSQLVSGWGAAALPNVGRPVSQAPRLGTSQLVSGLGSSDQADGRGGDASPCSTPRGPATTGGIYVHMCKASRFRSR